MTSYTDAMFIKDETKKTLRDALVILTSKLRVDRVVTVRVDAQSALKSEEIQLDIRSAKNKNKDAVAEKAIREFRLELVKQAPSGGLITETILAKAIRNLNSRIRHTGCSSKELWTKRDQSSGEPLRFNDSQLSDIQFEMRQKSHKSSAKYDSKDAPEVTLPDLKIGDTVYIKSDARKNKARDLGSSN